MSADKSFDTANCIFLLEMRLKIIILLVFGFFMMKNSAQAQSKEQVYAGIILHIMKYVEWPEYESQMTVGVVNNQQLVKALQKASSGKKVHYKNVTITTVSDLKMDLNADVLFFSKSALSKLSPNIVEEAKKNDILVISEEAPESQSGQGINFTQKGGSLKLELFMATMNTVGLKVSEQLKKIATIK